jgi:hypothetical protein
MDEADLLGLRERDGCARKKRAAAGGEANIQHA